MRPAPGAVRVTGTHSLVYLGIMGPQDGVDVLDLWTLVHGAGRTDVRPRAARVRRLPDELRRRPPSSASTTTSPSPVGPTATMIAALPVAADVGLCPDPKTPLNDVSTMNKTMEYMAYALPVVTFDLVETRVSGEDTVLYVESGDVQGFTDEVERLLDDPGLRSKLGMAARQRVVEELDWRPQSERYVGVYDELFLTAESIEQNGSPKAAGQYAEVDALGRRYVDVDDEVEFARFIVERKAPELVRANEM